MTTRILTPEEYPRLAGTLFETAWPYFTSEDRVVVAERDGKIVRAVSLHHEWRLDVWTAPAEQGRVSSGRALLKTIRQLLRVLWIREVVLMARTNAGRDLCEKIGKDHLHLDCDHYAVRMQ